MSDLNEEKTWAKASDWLRANIDFFEEQSRVDFWSHHLNLKVKVALANLSSYIFKKCIWFETDPNNL